MLGRSAKNTHMKGLLQLTLAVILSMHCLSSTKLDSTVFLLAKINEKLPTGWIATYEPEYSCLEVSRSKKVLTLSTVMNAPPDEKSILRRYSFAFRLGKHMSIEEHSNKNHQNNKATKALGVLYDQLIARRVSHKFDSFMPDNEQDRVLVSQYNQLKKSLHDLPKFYFNDLSLSWIYGSPQKEWHYVIDKKIRNECNSVRVDILSILTKYPNKMPNKSQ
jgi:hypothetical protein